MAGEVLSLFERPEPEERSEPDVGPRIRAYQETAVEAAFAGLKEHQAGVLVMPTGTGKTTVAAEIIRRATDWRILFLAEQRQILRQAHNRFCMWLGHHVGFEQAGSRSHEDQRVVCGMRQSLAAGDMRLERLAKTPPDLIIVDECHHHTGRAGSQYQKILERFPAAKRLGLTATPDRGDRISITKGWDGNEFYRLEIHESIEDGWLVPVKAETVDDFEPLDLSRVNVVRGELDEAAIEAMLAQIVKEQAVAIVKRCEKFKTIVSCGRVETAHQLAGVINSEMGRKCAMAIDGGMDDDDKDKLFDGFRAGEYQFFVNVGMAVEGFDCPDAVAAVLTRPFRSRGGFTQRCGRVLRPLAEGLDDCATASARRALIAASAKPWAYLLNFKFLAGRHTLVCPEDIFAGKHVTDEEKDRAKDLQDQEEGLTVTEALAKARDQIAEEKERQRQWQEEQRRRREEAARAAQAKARLDWGEFDPFGAFGVEVPIHHGPADRASPAMRNWMRSAGLPGADKASQVQAMKLRATVEARQKAGLATFGQIKFLASRGVRDPHRLTYQAADAEMTRLQRGPR